MGIGDEESASERGVRVKDAVDVFSRTRSPTGAPVRARDDDDSRVSHHVSALRGTHVTAHDDEGAGIGMPRLDGQTERRSAMLQRGAHERSWGGWLRENRLPGSLPHDAALTADVRRARG